MWQKIRWLFGWIMRIPRRNLKRLHKKWWKSIMMILLRSHRWKRKTEMWPIRLLMWNKHTIRIWTRYCKNKSRQKRHCLHCLYQIMLKIRSSMGWCRTKIQYIRKCSRKITTICRYIRIANPLCMKCLLLLMCCYFMPLVNNRMTVGKISWKREEFHKAVCLENKR